MSIIEKSDVERHRRDINLRRPVSQPDPTGFSVAEPDAIKPNPSAFSDDYSTEHSIAGKSVTTLITDAVSLKQVSSLNITLPPFASWVGSIK